MTTSMLKPDKPRRQPKEGSKEAALREMREVNATPSKKPKTAKLAEPAAIAATEAEAPAKAEPKESNVRKTKQTTKSKSRNGVNGKTSGVKPGTKLAIIAGLLTRKEGCTTADVLKACSWPSVSMPAVSRAAGLKLKKEKDGSVTRYRAT